MRIWYPLAFVAGSALGVASLSFLDEEMFQVVMIAGLLAAILLGWVATFENQAVRYAGLFNLGGILQPVWRQWFSPARPSWSIVAAMLVVGFVAGGCVRALLLAEA